ncbi:ABC transporter permease [Flavobacterium stagni]|uniref:ABC transporter permease n=1 Tax=Flavobacterium stagni TaxID=2506421 RepID=A0A4Q1KAD0_9FLAO|nr:FtsX-like permease family protein [Flavobacterium stagni]RXR23862.1 ABC transporter permease [Flavobacterium stagni]
MNLEFFIAKRLTASKRDKSSISAPIIKIATIAIALGMFMMLISVSTGVGLQQKIRDKIAAFNGHIIISGFNGNESDVSTDPISIRQKFYPRFKNVQGIDHVQAVAAKAGIIRTASSFEGIIYKGVGKDYRWDVLSEYLVAGKIPSMSGAYSNEVLISEFLANRLQLKVGSKFNTFFFAQGQNKLPKARRFVVSGIYNSGVKEFDSAYLIGDIRQVQRINHWRPDEVGAFEVFVSDFDQIAQKGEEVYDETSSTLNSETITEKYYYIFDWLTLFDANILIILIVMIVVSTINMVVALLVLILERTQMIGILKSMGANNWSIRKIFLYNAFHLIVRGLLWGNGVALLLLSIQKFFGVIHLNPESYYVTVAPVAINPLHILALNVGTILICLIVLLLPSYIITRIVPSKTIRFD